MSGLGWAGRGPWGTVRTKQGETAVAGVTMQTQSITLYTLHYTLYTAQAAGSVELKCT